MMNYVFHLIHCRVEGGELFYKVVSISQYDELCFLFQFFVGLKVENCLIKLSVLVSMMNPQLNYCSTRWSQLAV